MKKYRILIVLLVIVLGVTGCQKKDDQEEHVVHVERPYGENPNLTDQIEPDIQSWYKDVLGYKEFSIRLIQPLSKDKEITLRYLARAKMENESDPVYFEIRLDTAGRVTTNLPIRKFIYDKELINSLQYEFEGLVNAAIDSDELSDHVSVIALNNQFYNHDFIKSDLDQSIKTFNSFSKKNFNKKIGEDIITIPEYEFVIFVSDANYNNTDIADIMSSSESILSEYGIEKANIKLVFVDHKVHDALHQGDKKNLQKYVDTKTIEDTLFKNELSLPSEDEIIDHTINNFEKGEWSPFFLW